MKLRKPIKKLSDKRAKAHPELKYSTIAKPSSRLAKKTRTPVKRVNVKRKAKEFARCYGSVDRVEFVKSLRCSACGRVGRSENAHVLGNGGAGRKGHFTTIAPLCGSAFASLGCHQMFDEYSDTFEEMYPLFSAEAEAARTQAYWQAHVGSAKAGT